MIKYCEKSLDYDNLLASCQGEGTKESKTRRILLKRADIVPLVKLKEIVISLVFFISKCCNITLYDKVMEG